MQTVLVVDDEKGVRLVLSRMLNRLDYQALLAESGFEAVEIFSGRPREIDCVIVDLTMAGMDGEATLRALHEVRADVRVLLASGYSEQEMALQYAGAGFAGFIEKPFTIAALKQKLDDVLKSPV